MITYGSFAGEDQQAVGRKDKGEKETVATKYTNFH